jgi:hypothetical protein
MYAEFMVSLLDNLEPRFIEPGTIIVAEKQPIVE